MSQINRQEVPWIRSVPIIGNFFKSKSDNAQRTELMVLITPRLVRPLDPDEVPPLPTTPEGLPAAGAEHEAPKGEKAGGARGCAASSAGAAEVAEHAAPTGYTVASRSRAMRRQTIFEGTR